MLEMYLMDLCEALTLYIKSYILLDNTKYITCFKTRVSTLYIKSYILLAFVVHCTPIISMFQLYILKVIYC